MEIDFWRQTCGVSRYQFVRMGNIKRKMLADKIVNMKHFIWYGFVKRMPDDSWSRKLFNWVPTRRKRGRPRTSWKENTHYEMEKGGLQHDDWSNRSLGQ